MNSNTKELSTNEMEQADGGTSIPELLRAAGMAWDIYNCRRNNHNYVWQGELDEEVHSDSFRQWQKKILVCTKCGKKIVSVLSHTVG